MARRYGAAAVEAMKPRDGNARFVRDTDDGRRRLARALTAALLLVSGCAVRQDIGRTGPPATRPILLDVPFFPQQRFQCGPAALAMLLAYRGHETPVDRLTTEVYTPKRRGSLQPHLIAAVRRRGLVAYPITGRAELDRELEAGNPVIVLQNLGLRWWPRWHYAVVVGRTRAGRRYVLHTGRSRSREVGMETFLNTWRRAGAWGLILVEPASLPASATEQRWLEAVAGLERAGRYAEAARAYETALARWPASLGALIGLANARFSMGDVADAEDALRTAVAKHPRSAPAWNNLAHVLAVRGELDAARAAIAKALELGGPDRALYETTRAEIEARARESGNATTGSGTPSALERAR